MPPIYQSPIPKPSLRERLARRHFRETFAHLLFGDIIKRAVNAAVSVRVDDSAGWDPLSGAGPHDRAWSDLRADLDDALEAWRKNFMVRRLVTLTRSYAIGAGIVPSSSHRDVDRFIKTFWNHPQNRMDQRLGPMCDELVRSGELFVALFTNPIDGISYVRLIPADQVQQVETSPDDYELELRYGQLQLTTTELKWWLSPNHPEANQPTNSQFPCPVMLHYAINRPIGATRGESDLAPILKWALRYNAWLEDRVRLNRIRTRQGVLDVKIADDTQVESKKYQLRRDDPMDAGIYIHGPGEETTLHPLQIRAEDAEADGRTLRLAIAAGSNTALHYLGEGEAVNFATAKEMGEPTARFFAERQQDLISLITALISTAHERYLLATGRRPPEAGDLRLNISAPEVARADNLALAQAFADATTALANLRSEGWIDDDTAIRLAFKFAGENITEEQIAEIRRTATRSRDLPTQPRRSGEVAPTQEEG